MADKKEADEKTYLKVIRATVTSALCLESFASQEIERHNKPEVEARMNRELLLNPLVISRNEKERVLVEGSINSVRISIVLKKSDEVEVALVDRFSRFLAQRAEDFVILRRAPIKDYDVSFLITNFHLEDLWKHKLVDFLIHFLEDIDSDVSQLKLAVNSRARVVASTYLKQFV